MFVRPGVVALCLASACAAPPRRVDWSTDLDAARQAAAPDQLILVEFVAGQQSVLAALSDQERARLATSRPVRLEVSGRLSLFRESFEIAPQPALAITDAQGHWLAVLTGPVRGSALVAILERAQILAPLIRRLHDELAALPLRGPRATQRQINYDLAEAYLASGNPFESYRRFSLVTLMAADAPRNELVLRAFERLARLEVDRGNPSEAREWLAQLRERDANRFAPEVELTEAVIARAEARPREAMTMLSKLQGGTHPEPDRVLLEFGHLQHDTGKDAAARRAFQALLDRHPDSPWLRAAQTALHHLDAPHEHGQRPHRHE